MAVALKKTYSGIKGILKHEGVFKLISRGFVFLLRRTFWFEEYYLIFMNTHRVPEEVEEDFLPKCTDCCSRIITTNKEANDLLAEGFKFGAYELNLRASLDKNVI